MKTTVSLALVSFLALAVSFKGQTRPSAHARPAFETRCGWFVNLTRDNAWLNDREGEWTIGVQGGFQAEGEWPHFKRSQWEKTTDEYGSGCACLKVRVNKETHQILEIKSSRALSLSKCRRDPALK